MKKRLVRNRKPTLHAAPETSSDIREDQHNEELMFKLGREMESVELRMDEKD